MTATSSELSGALPSLVAPHYFSGQLLSDRDLDVLVEWTRARLSLGGRRDGFGVVAGLQLRPDPRTGHESDLVVAPGYAVGARGEDIVVDAEARLALADVSLPPDDNPRAWHPVDVFLEAETVRERPQPGFDYGIDIDEPRSTFSRVRERFKLDARAGGEDPALTAAGEFEQQYDQCMQPLRDYVRWRHAATRGPDEIRTWLRSRLLATEFRFAGYELDERSHEELREERTAVRALFWLIQHARNSFLAAFSAADACVRLGRVWLRAGTGSTPPTLVAIDAHTPFRRRLADPRLPAPSGSVNAGTMIWERDAVASLSLAQWGVITAARHEFELPHRLKRLEEMLSGRLFLRAGERAILQVYHHRPFGQRVVGVLAEEVVEEVIVDDRGDVEIEIAAGNQPTVERQVREPRREEPPPEPPRLGAAVIVEGPGEGARFDLIEGEEIWIGRKGAHIEADDDAEESFLDSLGRHGVLRVREGEVILAVTSMLGVEVNGHRVLGDGDTIRVGRTEVLIELHSR